MFSCAVQCCVCSFVIFLWFPVVGRINDTKKSQKHAQMTPNAAKGDQRSPRIPKRTPKERQGTSEEAQREPKVPPRYPKRPPKEPKGSPKGAQRGPKDTPGTPKTTKSPLLGTPVILTGEMTLSLESQPHFPGPNKPVLAWEREARFKEELLLFFNKHDGQSPQHFRRNLERDRERERER